MLFAFKLNSQCFSPLSNCQTNKLKEAIWIDLVDPDDWERECIQKKLNQILVKPSDLSDIEDSARFFEDEHGLHIHSFFHCRDKEKHVVNSTVAFTFQGNRLYTLRECDLPTFRLYCIRSKKRTVFKEEYNSYDLFLDIFEIKIEQLADLIESIYNILESLSFIIFKEKSRRELDSVFSDLAEQEDVGWKVLLCLMDSQRALNFLIRRANLEPYRVNRAKNILRDIESLLPHNESLFQKVNFLVQAAIGLINIEQSRIIKIFSVVSVIFLPPTLVASSYGMNFEFMPELHWSFGYPFVIILMIVVGLAPYLYFKYKDWL